jgi:hypothetical protein
MAESSAAPLRTPVVASSNRAPNAHRVHSSCDRCRSRKTKVVFPHIVRRQDINDLRSVLILVWHSLSENYLGPDDNGN